MALNPSNSSNLEQLALKELIRWPQTDTQSPTTEVLRIID